MPRYRVETSTGTYEIEADDDAQLEAAVSELGGDAPAAPQQPEQPQRAAQTPSALARLARGLKDPIVGLEQMVLPKIPGWLRSQLETGANGLVQFNTNMGDKGIDPQKHLAAQRQDEKTYQAARNSDGVDWMRLAGNVGSMAPLAAIAPVGGSGLVGSTLASVASGAATNSMMPVFDETKPFWEQKRDQAIFGGLTGGAVNIGQRAIAKAVAPKLSSALDGLMKRGVTPTPGQLLGKTGAKVEETLTTIPGIGDVIKNSQRRGIESFNRAVYDEVLAPIGQKFGGQEVGHEGVKAVGDALSKAYDDLVPSLQLIPDQELFKALDDAAASTKIMSDSAAKQFQRIVENELPRGPLAGEPLKRLESKLTTEIARFGKSTDPSDQMVSEALEDVRTAILDNLARVNPKVSERLSAINKGWSNLVRLERAAANTKEGVFTPEGLASAVKAADDSVRKRAVARGTAGPLQNLAKMGNEVLGRAYPDSGTAGRILTSGAALGYFEPTALVAAAAGAAPYTELGQKLATAILSKRPDFAPAARKMIERASVPVGTIAPLLGGAIVEPSKKQRHRNEGR